jgi:hypothetical protein
MAHAVKANARCPREHSYCVFRTRQFGAIEKGLGAGEHLLGRLASGLVDENGGGPGMRLGSQRRPKVRE